MFNPRFYPAAAALAAAPSSVRDCQSFRFVLVLVFGRDVVETGLSIYQTSQAIDVSLRFEKQTTISQPACANNFVKPAGAINESSIFE